MVRWSAVAPRHDAADVDPFDVPAYRRRRRAKVLANAPLAAFCAFCLAAALSWVPVFLWRSAALVAAGLALAAIVVRSRRGIMSSWLAAIAACLTLGMVLSGAIPPLTGASGDAGWIFPPAVDLQALLAVVVAVAELRRLRQGQLSHARKAFVAGSVLVGVLLIVLPVEAYSALSTTPAAAVFKNRTRVPSSVPPATVTQAWASRVQTIAGLKADAANADRAAANATAEQQNADALTSQLGSINDELTSLDSSITDLSTTVTTDQESVTTDQSSVNDFQQGVTSDEQLQASDPAVSMSQLIAQDQSMLADAQRTLTADQATLGKDQSQLASDQAQKTTLTREQTALTARSAAATTKATGDAYLVSEASTADQSATDAADSLAADENQWRSENQQLIADTRDANVAIEALQRQAFARIGAGLLAGLMGPLAVLIAGRRRRRRQPPTIPAGPSELDRTQTVAVADQWAV